MALQNIGASNSDDAFYRYKMPRMVTKIEGRGNGIKTNVVNMVDIAKALARPASYTTKYFGCELGAQSKFDEKTGIALVNGSHETAKLAGLLENFIKKYVQCYGCGNPETEIIITKTQMITMRCAACGFLSDVDMRDKLTAFILKNPPEQKKGKDKKAMRKAEKERIKEGEVADEEQKKLKKEAKKKVPSASSKGLATKKKASSSDEDHSPHHNHAADDNEKVDSDNDDVQWQTDTSLEAARQRIQEQLSAATADMVMLSTNEEKESPVEKSVGSSNGNGSSRTLVDEIREFLKTGGSAGKLKSFVTSLSGSEQEIMNALFVALFEDVKKGFAKEVGKKKNYLVAAIKDESDLMMILRGLEAFCLKASPEVVKEVGLTLKVLYDNDVLEEESIVEWYEKGLAGNNNKSTMWKNITPFIEWLQNAESEEE